MNDAPAPFPIIDNGPFWEQLFHNFFSHYPAWVVLLKNSFGILIGISIPLSVYFLIAIVYFVERLKYIRAKEEAIHEPKVEPGYEIAPEPEGDKALAARWDLVMKHIESENPNDWKLAIIDADNMLDSILTAMGYRGESVGEKLKRVEPGDFKSLNEAWEAHKVRNAIAHGRPDFELNHHEAKRVFQMYKKVFEEFYYV